MHELRGGSRVGGNISGDISGSGNDQPLFVIDGTPVTDTYSEVQSHVDVNDIDRIEVLKSVAATNEYGMRGANGVVLIYTKK